MKSAVIITIILALSSYSFSQNKKPLPQDQKTKTVKNTPADKSQKLENTKSPEKQTTPFEKASAMIKSEKASERKYGAEILASLRDPSGVPLLKNLLKDQDYSVRISAVDALGALRCYECEKDFSSILSSEKNIQLRQACVIAISYLGRVSDPSALIAASKPQEDKSLRISAIRTLGALNVKKAEKDFISYLNKENDSDIKKALIDALGKMKSQEGLKIISQYASDQDPSVRQYSLRALGDSGDNSFLDTIKARLSDDNVSVSLEAALSLAKLSDFSGLELAHKYLDNKDFSLQNQAMQIAALAGNEKTVSIIESKIKESKDENFKAMMEFTKQRILARIKNSK
ncbi:MAG: HEAT repeat domain-containing protein [Elusimicrobia bacterium]|nr:HEAT repeat domain-containing protein [Elusimicrobiota bacterium]